MLVVVVRLLLYCSRGCSPPHICKRSAGHSSQLLHPEEVQALVDILYQAGSVAASGEILGVHLGYLKLVTSYPPMWRGEAAKMEVQSHLLCFFSC